MNLKHIFIIAACIVYTSAECMKKNKKTAQYDHAATQKLVQTAYDHNLTVAKILALLDKKADPNGHNGNDTILDICTQRNCSQEIFKILFHHGADMHAALNCNYSPFERAFRKCDLYLCEFYLSYVNAKENQALLTKQLHTIVGQPDKIVARKKILDLLIKNNADPSAPNRDGFTPMHTALINRTHPLLIETLLASLTSPVSLNQQDKSGETPLHKCFSYHRFDRRHNSVEYTFWAHSHLIIAGASPDIANKKGVTPRDLAQTIFPEEDIFKGVDIFKPEFVAMCLSSINTPEVE